MFVLDVPNYMWKGMSRCGAALTVLCNTRLRKHAT